MIVGMGTDLVEIGRIRRSIELYGDRFLNRVYTPLEQAYCAKRGVSAAESFAARFAAKEAAMKALATGMWRGVNWKEFEVTNEASGRPVLRFHGQAQVHAERLRTKRIWISLSHAIDHALAVVVLED
jgi:holo-[acyl-carrier protein] synthase